MKSLLLMLTFLLICFSCSNPEKSKSFVDVCRCLSEPGNSSWMKENENACRDAISDAIGVPNWEKVNFSRNPDLDAKFDKLARDCGY